VDREAPLSMKFRDFNQRRSRLRPSSKDLVDRTVLAPGHLALGFTTSVRPPPRLLGSSSVLHQRTISTLLHICYSGHRFWSST